MVTVTSTPLSTACVLQVRFTARGNLVIAPNILAPQWEEQIQKFCVRPQRILIVDELALRKHYLASVDGMRTCAPSLA